MTPKFHIYCSTRPYYKGGTFMCGKSFYEENLGNINLSLHRLQSIDHINNTLLHLRTKNFCKKCDTLLATEIALRALKKLPPI